MDSPIVRISQGFLRTFGHKTLKKDWTKVKIFKLAQMKKGNIMLSPKLLTPDTGYAYIEKIRKGAHRRVNIDSV